MSTRLRRNGFTLIEVLVVVAIIALLVAILLPSLSRARFQAKLVACRSNLEQLGRATHMYATSYNGWFPITRNSGEDSFYAMYKARLVPDTDVLICPATKNIIRPETLKWPEAYDKTDNSKPTGVVIPYQKNPSGTDTGDICASSSYRDDKSGGHSYEYNGCYDTTSKGWPLGGEHKKVTQFLAFQAKISLVVDKDEKVDGTLFPTGDPRAAAGCSPSYQGNGNNCPQPWDNHGAEGTNMLFGDGHAEWVRKIEGDWVDMTALAPGDDLGKGSPKHSLNVLIDVIAARSSHPWNYFRR